MTHPDHDTYSNDFVDNQHSRLMQDFPPAPEHQVLLANWRDPGTARWSFNHLRQLLPTAPISPPPISAGYDRHPTPLPRDHLTDLDDLIFTNHDGQSQTLAGFLDAAQTDCFAVMKDGHLVYDWFGGFGAPDRQHIVFSITKSMAALLAGVLVGTGALIPDKLLTDYLPELGNSAYKGASVRHLLDMQIASGFTEDYHDEDGIFMAYRRAAAWNPVEEGVMNDGLRAFLTRLPPLDVSSRNHGKYHHYCSPHSDVLGWLIERCGDASFADLFSRHILGPCGARYDAYITLDTYGAPRVSGGLCITVHDLLNIGQMVLRGGTSGGVQVVPADWIADLFATFDNSIWLSQNDGAGPRLFTAGNYRSQWYQPYQDKDIIAGIGIHGQWLWIDRTNNLVIIKLASNGTVVDSLTDQSLLNVFAAITATLA